MSIRTEITHITPEKARELLLRNKSNRPIKERNLQYLVDEIRNGRWQFNGETIKISDDGVLIDGQHRLHAILRSGCQVKTVLITGIKSEAFSTIDTGSMRSPSDTLCVAGEKNSIHLAASLIIVHKLLRGISDFSYSKKISNTEFLVMLEMYPDIRNSIIHSKQLSKMASVSVMTAIHYISKIKNPEMSEKFFSDLKYGVNLEINNPVYLLRQRLIDNMGSKAKLTKKYIIALFIKAWNAYSSGVKLRSLYWRETGEKAEEFPTIMTWEEFCEKTKTN